MALELHKNSKPINCDKFCKITARTVFLSPELHTGRISFIIFFVLGILLYFFFLLFYNTLKNSNPKFQKLPVSKEIVINRNSQHVFKKTEET